MYQGGCMISIVFIKNPFDTDRKETHIVNYIQGQTVQKYIESYLSYYPDTDFHISINGHVLGKYEVVLICPTVGDQIVILPVVGKGFSDILRSIATIYLMSVVGGAGFLPHAGAFGQALARGAAMYIGGRIINAILPLPKQNTSSTSPTYGWDGAKSIAATGTPIGKTFGTVSPALVVLARHVTTDGDKQYLNILYGGGEGPIDSVDNITIDGNPITNYNVVQVAYDPSQLHDMCSRLYKEGLAWFYSFPQGNDRLLADGGLRDIIRDKRFWHRGEEDLRQHCVNADALIDPEDRKIRIVKRADKLKIDAIVAASMGSYQVLHLNLI